jgi:hypothetical protein
MEVKLPPELQAKLDNIAAQQGRDTASLVHEAVERFDWLRRLATMKLAVPGLTLLFLSVSGPPNAVQPALSVLACYSLTRS